MTLFKFINVGLVALALCLPAASFGQEETASEAEQMMWDNVRHSNDPLLLQTYLDLYPDGVFRVEAKARLIMNTPSNYGATTPDRSADDLIEVPTQCDQLAAHPEDLRKMVDSGVAMADLRKAPDAAVAACLTFANSDLSGRSAFQLSRAYFALGDEEHRMKWLNVAASRGWERAQLRQLLLRLTTTESSVKAEQFIIPELSKFGQVYPSVYIDIAKALRDRFGGWEKHGDQIDELYTKAYVGGHPDGAYYMARYVIGPGTWGDNSNSQQHFSLLLAIIDRNGKRAGWARNKLRSEFSSFVSMVTQGKHYIGEFQEDKFPVKSVGAFYQHGRAPDRGELGFGSNLNRVADVVGIFLDEIEYSDDFAKYPAEKRLGALSSLLVTLPKILPARENKENEILFSGLNKRASDLFCDSLVWAGSPANKAQIADICDAFIDKYKNTYFYYFADRHRTHRKILRGFDSLRDKRIWRPWNCIKRDDPTWDKKVHVQRLNNKCDMELKVGIRYRYSRPSAGEEVIKTKNYTIPANGSHTSRMTLDWKDLNRKPNNTFKYSLRACHTLSGDMFEQGFECEEPPVNWVTKGLDVFSEQYERHRELKKDLLEKLAKLEEDSLYVPEAHFFGSHRRQ